MRRKIGFLKFIVFVVLAGLCVQSLLLAFPAKNNQDGYAKVKGDFHLLSLALDQQQTSGTTVQTSAPTLVPASAPVSIDSVIISDDILNLIKNSDPVNYDKNVANYKELLVNLNVDEKYKTAIEGLITEGFKLSDILTAYWFLNDSYGKLEDVRNLVSDKAAGQSWSVIFSTYDADNPPFVPGSFDSGVLEELLNTPGITKDDIMIADIVSQNTSMPFNDLINKRESGVSWRDINAELDIVNGQQSMPHVPVEHEKRDAYIQSSGLSESQVVKAFVIAYKMDASIDEIIDKVKSGETREQIYTECLEKKYY